MKHPMRSLGCETSNSKKQIGAQFPAGKQVFSAQKPNSSALVTPSSTHVIASAGGTRTNKTITAQRQLQMSDRVAVNRNSVTLTQTHQQQQQFNNNQKNTRQTSMLQVQANSNISERQTEFPSHAYEQGPNNIANIEHFNRKNETERQGKSIRNQATQRQHKGDNNNNAQAEKNLVPPHQSSINIELQRAASSSMRKHDTNIIHQGRPLSKSTKGSKQSTAFDGIRKHSTSKNKHEKDQQQERPEKQQKQQQHRESNKLLPTQTQYTRLEMHEQALLQARQKKPQQVIFDAANNMHQPIEEEYGIPQFQVPLVHYTEPAPQSSPSEEQEELKSSGIIPQMRNNKQQLNYQRCASRKSSDDDNPRKQVQRHNSEQETGTQQTKMLPESIFTSLNGKSPEQLPQVNREKHQHAWKQVRTQRKSEHTAQRQAQMSGNQYQQAHPGIKVLNQSQERANSLGNGCSPYQAQQPSVNPLIQPDQHPSRQQTNKHLNNSLSIENERNRIHDVVNSSSFGPNYIGNSQNGLFGRTDCTASPMYRQTTADQEFANPKQAKTTVSRPIGSSNVFGGEEPNITQSTSAKGIPQKSNMQNLAVQLHQQQLQAHQNQKNMSRGLYQTSTQNNKYNFITPMVLSDLHQISQVQQTITQAQQQQVAFQQTRSDFNNLDGEEAKVLSPSARQSNAPRGNEYDSHLRQPQALTQEVTSLTMKSTKNNSANVSRQMIGCEITQVQQMAQYGSRHNDHMSRDGLRPQSGQFRRQTLGNGLNGLQIKSKNKIGMTADVTPQRPSVIMHSQQQQQMPPVVQKHRHLKTTAIPISTNSQPLVSQVRSKPAVTLHRIYELSQNEKKFQEPTRLANGINPPHSKRISTPSIDSDVYSDLQREQENSAMSRHAAEFPNHQTKLKSKLQLYNNVEVMSDSGGEQLENSLDMQMVGEDYEWSIASIKTSCFSVDDLQAQSEMIEVRPKDDSRENNDEEVQTTHDAASMPLKPSGKSIAMDKTAETNDYFNQHRLQTFDKLAQELDQSSNDPVVFSQHKVSSFLIKHPLNQRFLQKDKGRLPYSVFKPHASQVTFLKSIFEGRPPVAFFQYPSYVGIKRVADRIRMYAREEVEHLFMSFRISDSSCIYNAVVNSCKAAGFNLLESNNSHLFNLQWTGYIGAKDIKHLNKYQKTNHFPGSSQLGRKDLLWRNMSRMRSKFPKDFVIAPISYLIHEEYEAFNAERERDPSALWILKPVAASCGRGIKIYNSTQRVSKKEGMLAAKYIANPHLLNGLKYDMRVYVLVTSYSPLRIYMYNDGLVRFATEKYSNDPRKLQKKFMHLTNFSINKKNLNFVKNKDQGMPRNKQHPVTPGADEDEDQQEFDQNQSKWDFKMLRQAYEKQGINYEYVIAQFKDLIVKTLLCVEPHITQNLQKNPTSRVNCFELYGFDILVDQNHKPWVLEVNVLPSLSSSSPFDKRIKTMVICDTLTLVGIRGYDKQKFHSQTTELLGLAPFAQSMTVSELRQKPRLSGHERLTKDELEMLMDLDEEFMRRGNFQRIFPLASNAAFYDQFFETKRYQNALCASYLTSPQHIRDQLLSKYRRIYNSQV